MYPELLWLKVKFGVVVFSLLILLLLFARFKKGRFFRRNLPFLATVSRNEFHVMRLQKMSNFLEKIGHF